ncbi:MAG: transposase [Acidimicrobiales bacterium]
MGRSRRSFSPVVRSHSAKDLDVGPESLRSWVKQAQADAGERQDLATSAEVQELRSLRSENRELRTSVEVLCFSPRSSTGPRGGERLHYPAEGAWLRCRAHVPHPRDICQRLLPARDRPAVTRAQEDARRLAVIRRCCQDNYECYGSLRLWCQIRKDGVPVGRAGCSA